MRESLLGIGSGAEIGPAPGALVRWTRSLVCARLRALRSGALTLVDAEDATHFGDPAATLRATVFVEDPRFYRALLLRGALGGTEAWRATGGRRPHRARAHARAGSREAQAFAAGPGSWLRPGWRSSAGSSATRGRAAATSPRTTTSATSSSTLPRPTLTYSSGLFEREGTSMEEASLAKLERVCASCGSARPTTCWGRDRLGSFALHAAAHHGCRVTTTTISQRQYELARGRGRRQGSRAASQ
jgi:cyclopropane-fatty-acyl-phospholipid synthase